MTSLAYRIITQAQPAVGTVDLPAAPSISTVAISRFASEQSKRYPDPRPKLGLTTPMGKETRRVQVRYHD